MNKSFIEVYDNAIPDDICDYIVSTFEKENNRQTGRLREVRTLIEDEGEKTYVSALEMKLNDDNYIFDSIIRELDEVVRKVIFDYNKKYHVWSSELNMDLIPTEEEKEIVEEDAKNPDILSYYLQRHGEYWIKKYTHPNDGYYAYHTDWSTAPEVIQRLLAVQFYLNDVEDGGETEFYHQEIKIKPKKGRMVVWPVGFTHTHRGNKPASNDKYIISCWMTLRNLMG